MNINDAHSDYKKMSEAENIDARILQCLFKSVPDNVLDLRRSE